MGKIMYYAFSTIIGVYVPDDYMKPDEMDDNAVAQEIRRAITEWDDETVISHMEFESEEVLTDERED